MPDWRDSPQETRKKQWRDDSRWMSIAIPSGISSPLSQFLVINLWFWPTRELKGATNNDGMRVWCKANSSQKSRVSPLSRPLQKKKGRTKSYERGSEKMEKESWNACPEGLFWNYSGVKKFCAPPPLGKNWHPTAISRPEARRRGEA